jgi:hypothetical protein
VFSSLLSSNFLISPFSSSPFDFSFLYGAIHEKQKNQIITNIGISPFKVPQTGKSMGISTRC